MKKISSFLILLFSFINLFAQNTYVFLGSFNRDKNTDGIYVYQLNTDTGKLIKVITVKNILNPSFLTLSPDGNYVYACTESKTLNGGKVSSFKFDPANKKLTFINSQKSGGENPVYLTAHKNGKWLINANYSEGSISVYPISENGTIEPFVQNFHFEEGSIDPHRQERSHIHAAVFSPKFDYVFFPDLGADKIRVYSFDNEKTQPLEIAEPPFMATTLGSGPRHFTFHPNEKFAYCIEELTATIEAYHYESGMLRKIQKINSHSDRHTDNFESSDIHISPDGKFLYASNRGSENIISIFEIQKEGTLKKVGVQSTLGKHPRVFGMDESGNFLIATNSVSGDVVVFKRNAQNGLLKRVGKKLKIYGVSCVKIRKY
ncbi:lactonase family protein [Chryseobacterium sp. SNU WT5]|uniref:lactonase family protein n=1 Tax=Chryseobacterium sp. SNU WT5 TaxID=2594269 RepID=UPI00117F22A9|nr:lactonase family protein [Chryseobacterium sp. SNU WT5]QDP86474.1 lactonase family protein [Chryseobacterium sp. SNU WT5]